MTELCFNIWYYLKPNQTISLLAAKAYILDGSVEEKADMLRSLSRHDYRTVPAYELPAAVQNLNTNGVPYGALKDLGVEVIFRDVFAAIACTLPTEVPFPDDKLFYATPLFDFGEGFVPAEIGDGFIRDRD